MWTDRLSEQHAAEVADLALGVRAGGRPGHQPGQPHLHVSDRLSEAATLTAVPETRRSFSEPRLCNFNHDFGFEIRRLLGILTFKKQAQERQTCI